MRGSVVDSGFAVGIDTLCESGTLGSAQRVGLLSHQPAVCADGRNAAQLLHALPDVRLVRIFGPEHGFFCAGGAGEHVGNAVHPQWGMPVISLYGARRRPPAALIEDLDAVVIDLHDIGARCYTYLASMRYMLEACAGAGVPVIVCDRPIPLPCCVDGPQREAVYESFVAGAAVPMCYGLTPAECARWLVAQSGIDVDLTVAPMRGYAREAHPAHDWPEWIPPSPGIRSWETAICYLASVFTEGLPAIDCGRGTGLAFRLLGGDGIPGDALCGLLNAQGLEGVCFVPHRYDAADGRNAGVTLDGARICVRVGAGFRPVTTSVAIIWALGEMLGRNALWGDASVRPAFFDKLYGTATVREQLRAGAYWRDVAAPWPEQSAAYAASRQGALLYHAKEERCRG